MQTRNSLPFIEPAVYYRVKKSPLLDLTQKNPTPTPISCFLNAYKILVEKPEVDNFGHLRADGMKILR
jgi:hypothetical protein